MKKTFIILFAIHCIFLENFTANSSTVLSLKNKFSPTDSTSKPVFIIGGGLLLTPIDLIETKKSSVNFASPIIVTGAGMLLLSSSLKRAQTDWHRESIQGRSTMIDDYLAFAPNTLGLGLGIVGIKSKHNFKDRLLAAAMANSIMFGLVNGLKYTTKIKRPDNSANNSFPSGHTALAFTGAQIMHEEYGEQSIIYSIAGYSIGATTGVMRMINNKHWLSDVVVGAGIGMFSTKLAYRLLPWVKKKMSKKENMAIMPIYLPKGVGIGLALNIK